MRRLRCNRGIEAGLAVLRGVLTGAGAATTEVTEKHCDLIYNLYPQMFQHLRQLLVESCPGSLQAAYIRGDARLAASPSLQHSSQCHACCGIACPPPLVISKARCVNHKSKVACRCHPNVVPIGPCKASLPQVVVEGGGVDLHGSAEQMCRVALS